MLDKVCGDVCAFPLLVNLTGGRAENKRNRPVASSVFFLPTHLSLFFFLGRNYRRAAEIFELDRTTESGDFIIGSWS